MSDAVRFPLVLGIISLVSAMTLGFTYSVTREQIELQAILARNRALVGVLGVEAPCARGVAVAAAAAVAGGVDFELACGVAAGAGASPTGTSRRVTRCFLPLSMVRGRESTTSI